MLKTFEQMIAETQATLAKGLTPIAIHRMRLVGLNRQNRRRMQSLCRKGKLTARDIPTWLAALSLEGGLELARP